MRPKAVSWRSLLKSPKSQGRGGGATLKSPDSTRCHADDRARYRHKQLERETCGRAARQTQRIAFTRRAGGQGWQFDCVDSAQTVSIGKPRGQISAKRAFVLVYG
jgi:hypothetical protein